MNEDNLTKAARYFTRLHYLIASQMPRPGGFHIYSTGLMYSRLKTTYKKNIVKTDTCFEVQGTWTITISDGVPYSAYAMGYDANGNKRVPTTRNGVPRPLGIRERVNFNTIDNCMKQAAKETALSNGGKVVVK